MEMCSNFERLISHDRLRRMLLLETDIFKDSRPTTYEGQQRGTRNEPSRGPPTPIIRLARTS